jgi:hypothetical protein
MEDTTQELVQAAKNLCAATDKYVDTLKFIRAYPAPHSTHMDELLAKRLANALYEIEEAKARLLDLRVVTPDIADSP